MFGDIKIQELRTRDIQRVYNQWRIRCNASDKPMKAITVKHIDRIFRAALNRACELGYIRQNPAKGVRIGKDLNIERLEVYTTEEIQKLKRAVKGTDMELIVALLFDCVMRRGELLGLCFGDIDFDSKTVTIQHSWIETEDSKRSILKNRKANGSYRKIVVSDETIRSLKSQASKRKQICLKKGKPFTGEQKVVCTKDGEPYRPKSMTTKWAKTLKKYGLRHIKLHGMRHSAISWLLSQGVPLHMVQQWAGHQDPKVTLSVYSHIAKEDASRVADLLADRLFSGYDDKADGKISI